MSLAEATVTPRLAAMNEAPPSSPTGNKSTRAAPIRAALWMLGFTLTFAIMGALVRILARNLDPLEIAFFRNLFGVIVIAPLLFRVGLRAAVRTARPRLHLARSVIALIAMYCLFIAFARLPIADATALTFTSPLFATLGAALVLGEVVRRRRWTAMAVGFLGVLIVLRPGAAAIQPASLIALGAAMFMATSMLIAKTLTRSESPTTMVLYMMLIMTPLSLLPALFVWQWPAPAAWPLLAAAGIAGTVGQFMLARAFKAAEASAVMPFDFARLVFAAALGYLVFGEAPDAWTWVGGAVILASTVYIAHRESALGRAAPAMATPSGGSD